MKDKEVEKDNEELLGKQKQLIFENSKLKCKISELEREIIKKNEMYTILNQSYELNTAQAKQEKENLMERIKENEQKFNRDVVNLLTEKNRLEAEKINCLEQIAEVDEKRSSKNYFIMIFILFFRIIPRKFGFKRGDFKSRS